MKPTVRNISKMTGFSPATVSNALNGRRGVNSETSERILRAARDLGYFDSPDTEMKSPDSRERIRLILFRSGEATAEENSDFNALMKGIEKACFHSNFEIALMYLDRESRSFESQVNDLLADQTTASILVGSEMTEEDFHYFDGFVCPVVIIGFWKEGMRYSAVLPDNELAVAGVVNYLIKKGHRRIGHLRSSRRTTGMAAREYWFRTTLEKNGISCDSEDSLTLNPGFENSYREMTQYLQREPRQMPTAYIADSDEIALGAMKALQERGIRIPDEISVTGIGDFPFAQIVSPGLSTIRFSGEEIGSVAVQTLKTMIGQQEPSLMRVMISPRLIERESVRDMNETGIPVIA